jgi:two-component system OmpR family sensor kinase
MKRRYLLALLPAILGFGISVVLTIGSLQNPIVSIQIDMATFALFAGVFISTPWSIYLVFTHRSDQKHQKQIDKLQLNATQDRMRFLQRLDHELKNPLTAIQAGLANLNGDVNLEAVESIKIQTSRLGRLVADLRKLAELESRAIEQTSVDLSKILIETVEIMEESSHNGERKISLNIPQAPWPLPLVSGDPDLLFLTFHNLLSNALKFSQPGDAIEVRAYEDDAAVMVEIADTGPGIPSEELPHVWQELYRGQNARGVSGSGLGLPLVRAIVNRHGGQVTLRSRAGQGTVVSVRLPVQTPGSQQ